ncbi:MAG: hypothetical protein M3Y09_15520 [Actinomycetota bacterium]|nr:hypothetical protein [Actinomycetota bacterium]
MSDERADCPIHEPAAVSVASNRPGNTSALDQIHQQGADLLSLVEEHLRFDPNGFFCAELRRLRQGKRRDGCRAADGVADVMV